MRIPKALQKLIESFEKLPGIGPKTAQRLTFYLLHVPQGELEAFAQSLQDLKKNTVLCSTCKNVGETDPCWVCADKTRDKKVVMVVEQPLDLLALEKTRKFRGVYHVLHGAISPLEGIGPDEIFIDQLIRRAGKLLEETGIEVILATNPTMEGEATAMYIKRQLEQLGAGSNQLAVSRLGVGLPTGADLEYADEVTLTRAIEGRRSY